jgi:hypothetical protein
LPSREEGPSIIGGSSSKNRRATQRKRSASENALPTSMRRISSKRVNGPSKEEGSDIRDGHKKRPTRMKRIVSENERPAYILMIPSTTVNGPSEEGGSKNRDGSFSKMGRPSKMKMSATETKMPLSLGEFPP